MKRVTYQHNGGMLKFLVKVISSEIKKKHERKNKSFSEHHGIISLKFQTVGRNESIEIDHRKCN